MGYVESQSLAPDWLSPHTNHRQLLAILEKMEAGFEIDKKGSVPSSRRTCGGFAVKVNMTSILCEGDFENTSEAACKRGQWESSQALHAVSVHM
jgi:hypothetical protein